MIPFFWARKLGFQPEIPFFFANGLFVALGETVHLPPWDQFFRLFVSKLRSFFLKNSARRAKKSSARAGLQGDEILDLSRACL